MPSNPSNRKILRDAYNRYAQERDESTLQDWKIAERAKVLALFQQEHKTTLLEIGAGTGRDSLFFQEQGLNVTCIDLSPVMVELCRQKGLQAFVMDMVDISFPNGSFDAVYAMNSLLHLTKSEFPTVLRRVDRLLQPDGLFYLGIYGGFDFEGIWDRDQYTPQRFFSFFSDAHIQQELAQVFDILAFKTIETRPGDAPHFQSILLKKKPVA